MAPTGTVLPSKARDECEPRKRIDRSWARRRHELGSLIFLRTTPPAASALGDFSLQHTLDHQNHHIPRVSSIQYILPSTISGKP